MCPRNTTARASWRSKSRRPATTNSTSRWRASKKRPSAAIPAARVWHVIENSPAIGEDGSPLRGASHEIGDLYLRLGLAGGSCWGGGTAGSAGEDLRRQA